MFKDPTLVHEMRFTDKAELQNKNDARHSVRMLFQSTNFSTLSPMNGSKHSKRWVS
jgi:hypothetical protein